MLDYILSAVCDSRHVQPGGIDLDRTGSGVPPGRRQKHTAFAFAPPESTCSNVTCRTWRLSTPRRGAAPGPVTACT